MNEFVCIDPWAFENSFHHNEEGDTRPYFVCPSTCILFVTFDKDRMRVCNTWSTNYTFVVRRRSIRELKTYP